MKYMKQLLLALSVVLLIIPNASVSAATKEKQETRDGDVDSKDEVIYATLDANGNQKDLYVVNRFEINKAGEITDYGDYTSIKNLTDLSNLTQTDNKVKIDAPEGKFYYQGDLESSELPWDVNITYYVDGEKISADEIAGETGKLKIKLETSANKDVDQTFFDHYMLQIDIPFDGDKTSTIKAKDGTIANAGKDQQVTFTVMPEEEKTYTVQADVEDFEMDGIDISGVPSSVSIDKPDTDEMTGDIKTLSDAIHDINQGVSSLASGVSKLNNGALTLQDGSNAYKNGIDQLDQSSASLVNGSEEFNDALTKASNSLDDLDDFDLDDLDELAKLKEGLSDFSGGIRTARDGLNELKDKYTEAYQALDKAIDDIPSENVSEDEIKQLYDSDADKETIDKLVESYTAAKTAQETYHEVKEGFDIVGGTLDTMIQSLDEMEEQMEQVEDTFDFSLEDDIDLDGLSELTDGIRSLSSHYQQFHQGLVDYTDGVGELSNSYGELDNGISELASGTNELDKNVGKLQDGTAKLDRQTSNLPKEMTKEIDKMIDEFDKSDFDAVSFVSSKNKNIHSVQFVLQTEAIEKPEAKEAEENDDKPSGFWAKLKDLFS